MSGLTNFFIPPDFAPDNDIERRRAEIAVKTVYVLFPWGVISSLFVLWLTGSFTATAYTAASPLMIAIAPFALRYTRSLNIASLFILIPMFASFTRWSVTTGGVVAPGTSWLLLLPVMALIFCGMRTAIIWLIVVVVTWSVIFAGGQMGYIAPIDVTEDRFPARRMIELMALGTTVFGLFYLKDNLQSWLISKVRKKEAETRAVVETAPDGILTVDFEGTILSGNDAASRIFGHDRQELLQKNIESLITTFPADGLRAAFEQRTPFGTTEEHQGHRRGEEFPLEVAIGILDDEERPRAVLVLRDITDRKLFEEKLRQARDAALEASQAKSIFLANMSHELRTPLNAVIGYSEMILEEIEYSRQSGQTGTDAAAEFVPDLERIHSAGRHLLSLISHILDLSKIEAGKMTTHIERFDIPELVNDIVATIQPLANQNENQLRIKLAEDLSTMCSDSTKVRQILFNLLSNACKFTTKGIITLSAELDSESDQVIFSVQDTGIGMTAEQAAKVFDAFNQADGSTTREFGGTGLGLTITSHFCALLNGEIGVSSSPGEGTTFTARIARNLEEHPEAQKDEPSPSTGSQPDRQQAPQAEAPQNDNADTVLVIDDDATVRDLLRRMLEREGFRVVTAATGSEGLFVARQISPCAITLDVMMPSMDGWTMLSRLKEDPDLSKIPVIMVSMLSEEKRGYALGADHYLLKPVQRQALVEILDRYRQDPESTRSILLLEDDEPTRSLMRRILTADGWHVTEAKNGVDGLHALEQITPALILLDLMMPEMDGFEFLERLRQNASHRNIPVVVLTAMELTAEDQAHLNKAVTNILTKSGTDLEKVLDQIRETLGQVAADVS